MQEFSKVSEFFSEKSKITGKSEVFKKVENRCNAHPAKINEKYINTRLFRNCDVNNQLWVGINNGKSNTKVLIILLARTVQKRHKSLLDQVRYVKNSGIRQAISTC